MWIKLEQIILLTALKGLMSTNFLNTKRMKKIIIGILLLFNSVFLFAHQSDLSTVMIYQDEKGNAFYRYTVH